MPLTVSLWQKLNDLDKFLFLKLNSQFTNSFFDAVLPFFRASSFWVPLYFFLVVFILLNFGKNGLWWTVALLCTVAITDQAGNIFKHSVQRLRPCQDPYFFSNVRLLLQQCSGSYSFVSNHAANHFGLATFIAITFKTLGIRWINITYLWAALVAYSQIYVGVHYPSDVVGGMFLGILSGILTGWVFNKNITQLRLS